MSIDPDPARPATVEEPAVRIRLSEIYAVVLDTQSGVRDLRGGMESARTVVELQARRLDAHDTRHVSAEARLTALEGRRWPLPSVQAVVGVAALLLTMITVYLARGAH